MQPPAGRSAQQPRLRLLRVDQEKKLYYLDKFKVFLCKICRAWAIFSRDQLLLTAKVTCAAAFQQLLEHFELCTVPELPHITKKLLMVGGSYGAFHLALQYVILEPVLSSLDPRFKKLPRSTRAMLVATIAAMVHHAIVVPISFKALWRDATLPEDEQPDYLAMQDTACLSAGYFLGDSLFLLPYWLRGEQLEYMLHHLAGLGLIAGPIQKTAHALRWAPFFLQAECTSLVFGLTSYLKGTGRANHAAYSLLLKIFAVGFLLSRIVLMPAGVLAATFRHKKGFKELGVYKYLMHFVCILQFYWFSKIVAKVGR